MAAPGNDPFSATGPNAPNLINHVLSPKIVSGPTGYNVKLDLINVDNSYIQGTFSGKYVTVNRNVAIGEEAGLSGQQTDAVAIGYQSGRSDQGISAVAVGVLAGFTGQGSSSVAIGNNSGYTNQGERSVAIGIVAGNVAQGSGSVAIGDRAGFSNQASDSIAIGKRAGFFNQPANTIILNASGFAVNGVAGQTSSFYVNPVRQVTGGVLPPGFYNMAYNPTTSEIIYWS